MTKEQSKTPEEQFIEILQDTLETYKEQKKVQNANSKQ